MERRLWGGVFTGMVLRSRKQGSKFKGRVQSACEPFGSDPGRFGSGFELSLYLIGGNPSGAFAGCQLQGQVDDLLLPARGTGVQPGGWKLDDQIMLLL